VILLAELASILKDFRMRRLGGAGGVKRLADLTFTNFPTSGPTVKIYAELYVNEDDVEVWSMELAAGTETWAIDRWIELNGFGFQYSELVKRFDTIDGLSFEEVCALAPNALRELLAERPQVKPSSAASGTSS
jgi:hypothetical protein